MAGFRSASQFVRYYQAGIVNTVFGYSMYAILVTLGLNMYVAQLAAHVMGTVFNYYTYSRYAFRDPASSKVRFVLSYVANFLLGAAMLWACAQVIPSPYLAMAVAIVIYTSINYVVLKKLVFTSRPQTQ
jgi:putative flippase GtrA